MGLSARQLAKALGVSHSSVNEAAARGRIQREPGGGFDLEKSKAAWNENIRARRPEGEAEGPSMDSALLDEPSTESKPTLAEAQRQREWVRLEKEQTELRRRRGELVELAPINAWVAGMIIAARDDLTRIGEELRDALAQSTDPIECQRLVDGRIRQALQKLSEYQSSARV